MTHKGKLLTHNRTPQIYPDQLGFVSLAVGQFFGHYTIVEANNKAYGKLYKMRSGECPQCPPLIIMSPNSIHCYNELTAWQALLMTHRLYTQSRFQIAHDDIISWIHFPRYWPFVLGIHSSPVNSPHKGQWSGAFMFSLICALINGWVNNREACDLRYHRAHKAITVMIPD